ncbi:ParB/RepB/Spo0J family partition protein [Streptomyces sp. NPDC048462]|uniref:ParB/RepB/Spo0J family partition protein n=1 Tax=Streptomyces sp. NPDC048462 TaxID=3365555 RepID=UPI0037167E8E
MRERNTKTTQERVTRGFTMDEDGSSAPPRRVRTREQIARGEGKRPPASVVLAELAHNPFNPREELTDVDETAASLTAKGQIQPVTVVRREVFLEVHPGQEEVLGSAPYVVIDGNRRLAAAHKAGLTELRIDVNDGLAASAADILESALIANIHRVDVAPIDQAKALQELVQVHGQQKEVAARLGKTGAWVSQRLALLKLPADLQDQVEDGTLKVKDARRIGALPPEQQHGEAEKAVNRVKSPRRARGAVGPESVSGPAAVLSGVAVADPSVPAQASASGSPEAPVSAGVNPVNRAEGEGTTVRADPLSSFSLYVEKAEAFAAEMRGIAAAYRQASDANQQKADALVEVLRERLDRVTRHLPSAVDE